MRQKKVLAVSIVILLVSILLLLIVLTFKYSNLTTNNTEIKFQLDTPAFDLERPTKQVLKVNSSIIFEHTLEVSKGVARLNGEGFEIVLFTNMGESGGLYENVKIVGMLKETRFGKPTYKVNTAPENFPYNMFDSQFSNYYFYSEDFYTRDECGNLVSNIEGCGIQHINVGSEFQKYSYSIYCGTDNTSDNCDEFVNNLVVRLEEVR